MTASPGELGAAAARISAVGSRLTTAAGLAGIAFAVLFTVSFALLRVGIPPAEGQAFATWWEANRDRVAVGTYLIPFTGIAFLWFVAAVRERIGRGEGLFFSTIFLGSALLFVATAFVTGAAAGAMLVLRLRPDFLRPLILVLLIAAAILVAVARAPTDAPERPRRHVPLLLASIALVVGTYDGFFGPGTGTFLITGYVVLLGLSFRRATANGPILAGLRYCEREWIRQVGSNRSMALAS